MTAHSLSAAAGAVAILCLCAPLAQAGESETPQAQANENPAPDPNDPATHDPFEGLNRAIFEVNGVFYEITTPLVEATPDPIRGLFKAVGTAVKAPVHIVTSIATNNDDNDDLADIARENDVDCGFFVVLPLAGPMTSRDAVGEGLEIAANPAAQIVYLAAGSAANDRIEAEVQIRQLEGAVDEYALARSATLQERGCVVTQESDAPSAFGTGETAAAK